MRRACRRANELKKTTHPCFLFNLIVYDVRLAVALELALALKRDQAVRVPVGRGGTRAPEHQSTSAAGRMCGWGHAGAAHGRVRASLDTVHIDGRLLAVHGARGSRVGAALSSRGQRTWAVGAGPNGSRCLGVGKGVTSHAHVADADGVLGIIPWVGLGPAHRERAQRGRESTRRHATPRHNPPPRHTHPHGKVCEIHCCWFNEVAGPPPPPLHAVGMMP